MPDRELEGRVALVTGGSRGIGAAVCAELARAGAEVVVNYTANAEAAESVRAAIGEPAHAVKGDVSKMDGATGLVDHVESHPAAGAHIELDRIMRRGHAARAPPLRDLIGVGPRVPHR